MKYISFKRKVRKVLMSKFRRSQITSVDTPSLKMASLQSLWSVGSLGLDILDNPDCRTPVTRQIVKLDTGDL